MKTVTLSGLFRNASLLMLLLTLPFVAFAGIRDTRSSQIQLLGSNFGSGLSLGYHFGDMLFLGAEYFSITLESEGENTANEETVKGDFSTTNLHLRFFPFEGSGFYLQGGLISRVWKITVTGTDVIGDSGQSATYELEAKWPSTAINYSLGFNWIADFGLSAGINLGVITGDDPELKGKVDDPSISQADVDKEVDEIEEEEKFGETYSTLPIVGLYLGFSF